MIALRTFTSFCLCLMLFACGSQKDEARSVFKVADSSFVADPERLDPAVFSEAFCATATSLGFSSCTTDPDGRLGLAGIATANCSRWEIVPDRKLNRILLKGYALCDQNDEAWLKSSEAFSDLAQQYGLSER